MSIEQGLDKIRKSSVTWLVAALFAATVTGAMQVKGLYDTVGEIQKADSKRDDTQEKMAELLVAMDKRLTIVEDRQNRR